MIKVIWGTLISLAASVVLFMIVAAIIGASNDLTNILAMTFVISIQISFITGLILYKKNKAQSQTAI